MKALKPISYALALGLMVSSGCSSSSTTATDTTDTDTDTPAITTIEALPNATGPVVATSSSALRSIIKNVALTGLNLRNTDSTDFSADDSVAACEMLNQTKQAISAAADGDNILCYIKQADTGGVDIYDGQYHTFDIALTTDEEEGGPDHIKMKVVKTGNNVTGFEMFACREGQQFFYLNQTITGSDFSMTSKETSHGGASTNVTGTLDAEGRFTGTKTINVVNIYEGEGENSGSGYGNLTFLQSDDGIEASGYQVGEYEGGGCSGSYSNRILASAQLIDDNAPDADIYDIGLLALGDGGVRVGFSGEGSCEGQGDFDYSDTGDEGWNGDTLASEETNDYLDNITDELPSVGSEPTIAFSGSEVYNCGDTATGTLTLDQEQLSTACANYELSHNWINCYDITNSDD